MFDGSVIRKLRKEKNLSLKELSSKSSVSIATVSQIERDNTDPAITTLYKLCKGLDVTIAELIGYDDNTDRVVKKRDRKTITLPDSKLKYQLLSSRMKRNLEMVLVELEPHQEDRKLVTHKGEECGYVLQGSLTIILDNEEIHLEEGDSISFNSTIPHRYVNPTDEKSMSVWAMTPPSF
ncbi:helix-turn-helix domain-containing protein [Salibacterium aidingense]|uniref:helix-turn-helix domain-containing protein n=1 Tax=Salibacterium aidingense TaxID=384933 RepID=UPI0003FE5300|nr:XRE family transcriptional regulator [Salibacterium aidingense]